MAGFGNAMDELVGKRPAQSGSELAARWRVAISGQWTRTPTQNPPGDREATAEAGRCAEHINVLELRTAGYGLNHALRCGMPLGARCLLLTDSTVALHTLTKGRSSAAPLLRVMRGVAARLLATGVRPIYRFVESERNPADLPSRLALSHGTPIGWSPLTDGFVSQ